MTGTPVAATRMHMSPELDGDGFFEDIEFDDANGFKVEFGWKWIGLHYTKIEYSSPRLRGRRREQHRHPLHGRFGRTELAP